MDNGLFWTIPVHPNSVKVDPGSGRASLAVNNLELEDYSNVVNALMDGPSNPATVSFEIHWAPGMSRFKVRDETFGVAGQFIRNTATMAWASSSAGQSYVSDPENTSASVSGQVGHERNGVFFP